MCTTKKPENAHAPQNREAGSSSLTRLEYLEVRQRHVLPLRRRRRVQTVAEFGRLVCNVFLQTGGDNKDTHIGAFGVAWNIPTPIGTFSCVFHSPYLFGDNRQNETTQTRTLEHLLSRRPNTHRMTIFGFPCIYSGRAVRLLRKVLVRLGGGRG